MSAGTVSHFALDNSETIMIVTKRSGKNNNRRKYYVKEGSCNVLSESVFRWYGW